MDIHEEKFSPRQTGKILGVSRQTIITLIDTGKLRAIKVGGQWRIMESALAEFMKKNETRPKQVRAF